MAKYFAAFKKNKFLRFGAPFIGLLVAGSFGLREFAQLRYTFRKSKLISSKEAEKLGLEMSERKPTIENEYEKLKADADLDTWQNIRGPRPWENSKEVQDAQRKHQDTN